MRAAVRAKAAQAISAAASLTGKRFGLLVASSVVATAAVVASAITGTGGSGALAALLARNLGAHNAAALGAPAESGAPVESAVPPASEGSAPAAAPEPSYLPPTAAPAPAPASEPAAEGPTKEAPGPAPEAGPVKHVFVISLTSPGYERAFGAQSQMPYLSGTLRPQGLLLDHYAPLDAGALPNGIAAISGQPPNPATKAGCPEYEAFAAAADKRGLLRGAGCVYPVETLTIADQLTLTKQGWRAYVGGMVDEAGKPANCVHPSPGEPSTAAQPGGYAAAQNPFAYFHSLLDLGDCAENDAPLARLEGDLAKAEKAPGYAFIAPTPCEAGSAGQCPAGAPEGAAAADAFLSTWVPKILAAPAYEAGGALIVAFSAVDPAEPGGPAPAGEELRTGALVVSPFAQPGGTDSAPYDTYSLLRSSEELLGLEPLGLAAAAKVKSFAAALSQQNGGD
ncbi:MAG TPA: alkaline phosphatase family protein [Solirubrobacterales bacterium]|nr:alkaline phosphatase family protein [Solirubrobacterales bacterium]